jgi:glycosyltransferase involved in cell wall biosynthesis
VRILIVSQYFTPEMTAAPLRLRPLAAGLAERGHEVEVISEVPSHPQGRRYPGFGLRPVQRRRLDGFGVSYVWAYAAPSRHPAARVLAYASYATSAALRGASTRRPDVVFASSPPLSVGLVGELIARRHRVPWVFDVRDLWPAAVDDLGSVRSSRLLDAATAVERRLYRSAAAVTTATEPFKHHVAETVDPGRVLVLPNGTTRAWLRAGEADADRAGAALPAGEFVWTYAGNVGLSQDLATAIAAATRLGQGFRLLVVGDGASRRGLEALASDAPAGTVEFRDPVAPEGAMVQMRASDVLLVSLVDRDALAKTVPVKLYDSAALGRPLIVAAPGESRRIADEAGVGLAVPPGDAERLAGAVRRLRDDARLRERLGKAGRRFAAASLREDQVEPLEALLARVAA